MQLLGLTKPPGVKHHFLNQVLRQLEEQGEAQLTASKEDQILGDPQWDRIRDLTKLDTGSMLQRYLSMLHHQSMRRSQLSLGAFFGLFVQYLYLHASFLGSALQPSAVPASLHYQGFDL